MIHNYAATIRVVLCAVQTVELKNHGVTFPHTAHCLATGDIMISCLGDKNNDALGMLYDVI